MNFDMLAILMTAVSMTMFVLGWISCWIWIRIRKASTAQQSGANNGNRQFGDASVTTANQFLDRGIRPRTQSERESQQAGHSEHSASGY